MSDQSDIEDILEALNDVSDAQLSDSYCTADETLCSRRVNQSAFDSFVTASPGVASELSFTEHDDHDVSKSEETALNTTLTIEPSQSGLKMVPLDFSDRSTPEAEKRSFVREQHVNSSDDEDEEILTEKKKPLSEAGLEVKKMLNKVERRQHISKLVEECAPPPKGPKFKPELGTVSSSSREKTKEKLSVAQYDPFFKFKVFNPKVGSDMFETLCDGMQRVRLSALSSATPGNFITMGVLIERKENRKSANGNEYTMWMLHDLKDTQKQTIKTFLFGEAFKKHYKLGAGIVVALVNPQIQEPSEKDKSLSLRLVRSAQIIEIGWSADLGTCRGVKSDGSACSNFVNKSLSDFCVFHVMSQARKLSSKRGTFNSTSNIAPMGFQNQKHKNARLASSQPNTYVVPRANQQLNASGSMKVSSQISFSATTANSVMTKDEEKKKLQDMIAERAHMLGARNLVKLDEAKNPEAVHVKQQQAGSIADFLKDQTVRDANTAKIRKEEDRRARLAALRSEAAPRLTVERGAVDLTSPQTRRKAQSKMDASKLRAVQVMRMAREEGSGGVKRKSSAGLEDAKRMRVDSDETKENENNKEELQKAKMDELLNRRSKFDVGVKQAESEAINRYMDTMEVREKIETFTTSTMSVQNVKVVSCKKCNYTAQTRSSLCMREGHAVKYHTAEKRFFKCKGCKKRTIAFGLLPSKPCEQCDGQDWERVGMREERKVTLETEKLQLRGEERKFI